MENMDIILIFMLAESVFMAAAAVALLVIAISIHRR